LLNFSYKYEKKEVSLIQDLNQEEYSVSYINVGASCFVDSNMTISHLPKVYSGCSSIKTAIADFANNLESFLRFYLSDTSTVCVAYDASATSFPSWLLNNFEKTNNVITINSNAVYHVWESIRLPGYVTLGGNMATGAENVTTMYFVIVINADYALAGELDNMEDPSESSHITHYKLFQNYPNPFNAHTEIPFQLPKEADVEISIFNIRGQLVRELAKTTIDYGKHILWWDGKDAYGTQVITGTYFIRLIVKEKRQVNNLTIDNISYKHVIKMTLIK
jgi:hypothetical protein